MTERREPDIARLDANLLAPLRALLEQAHVTRAAEQMHLSQSAMSTMLARLRRHFGDELLVRTGSSYTLTPLAHRLLPLVTTAIASVERAFSEGRAFDPVTSHRRFVITASDYAAGVVAPPLRSLLRTVAPHVAVEFRPMPVRSPDEQDVLRVDLFLGPLGYGFPGNTDPLFDDDYVCLFDAAHPAASSSPATTIVLARTPHAVTSFASQVVTLADAVLDRLGVERETLVVVNDWLSLPWVIRGTDMVAVLPRRAGEWAAATGRFAVVELPGADHGGFTEALHWHPSKADDEGLFWLRHRMAEALAISG